MRIAVLHDPMFSQAQLARLGALGTVVNHRDTIDLVHGTARLRTAEIAIVDGFKLPVTRALIEGAHRLRLLVLTSTAYHMVDFDAANERRITVANIPGYSTEAVAEHAIALLFAVARTVTAADRAMRAGPFQIDPGNPAHRKFLGFELRGKTLGVIGLGAIGRRVAEIGNGLGMSVLGYNRTPRQMAGVRLVGLNELLSVSDVVSLNLAVHPDTKKMISERELRVMKPGAVLINTAGGELVDTQPAALYRALSEGRLSGAGLDVLDHRDDIEPLLALDNVVLSPLSGAWTQEACANLAEAVVATIEAFARGAPINLIGDRNG